MLLGCRRRRRDKNRKPDANPPLRFPQLSALLALTAAALAPPPAYVIVLDAGSSGTRIHVYAVHPPPSAGALPRVKEVTRAPSRRAASRNSALDRVETTPGLAALAVAAPRADLGAAVEAALAPLLAHAVATLPGEAHAATPILLAATGGVRKLAPGDADAVLAAAGAALASSPFPLARPPRALAGADEAAYAWAAVNYVGSSLVGDGAGTTAVADLGGATLEVATAVAPTDAPPATHPTSRRVVVGAITHTLTATSHAGLGLDDAFEALVETGAGGGRACAPPVSNFAACLDAAAHAAANVTRLPPGTTVAPVGGGFAVAATRVGARVGAPAAALEAATAAACTGSAPVTHRACFGGAHAVALLRALGPATVARPPRGAGWALGAALLDGLPAVKGLGAQHADAREARRRLRARLWVGAVAAAAVGGGVAAGRLAVRRRAARD